LDTHLFDFQFGSADRRAFFQTINRLRGKVMMLFITHQVPKGLQVDEIVNMGLSSMFMSLVKEDI
jgi:subfamily B ATP-binding cassette protein HlyB/CyaB